MKLKYDFVVNQVAGETVAVSVGNNDGKFNGYIKLNETAAFIFEALKNDTTCDKIIANLKNAYPDADETDITDSVNGIIEKLEKAELLE